MKDQLNKNFPIMATAASSFVANTIMIQKKLTVGEVNDPLEHEADAMADKVMRMPESNFKPSPIQNNLIQRKCSHCEEEEKAQRKPLVSFIQRKESTNSTAVSDNVSSQIQSTKGSGNKMPETTKSFMESRFGTNFSSVNIHTGNYAAQLSNQLNAQAFTVGNDIYFNEGRYQPESFEGKQLLAHELTHTVQQGNDRLDKKIIQRRILRNSTVNYLCGNSRDAVLRTPPSGFFRLNGRETQIKITSNISWDRPASCSVEGQFYMVLKSDGSFWDSTKEEATISLGSGQIHTFSGLNAETDYYFEIHSTNTNPNCCLTGNIIIEAL